MSTDSPTPPVIDPSAFSFGIVCSRFNESLTQSLLDRVLEVLQARGKPAELKIERVPVPMKYLPGFPSLPQVVVIPA